MKKIGKIKNGVFTPYANMSSGGPGDISNAPITFEQATELANVQSGDSVSVALGKLSKLYETLESGSASTLLGESLEANRIMETDGGGKVATSGLPRDRLDNLKILIFDSTRTELLESGNVGATYFLTNTNTHADELPSGAPEWKYAGGLLIKRTNMIASIVIYGYGTGNTAITTTGDGGQTWSSYKNVQEQVGSLEAALNATNFNFKLKKYVDTECSSHIEVLQKYWNEAFEDVPAAGGYRIILTAYGSGNVVWTCYSNQSKVYGYALCFANPSKDISSPRYYTISNGTWSGIHELIEENDLYKKCATLSGGTAIPANADLDSYKTLGNYCCDTSAVAATLQNCPTNIAFKMVVDYATGYGYTRQILIPYKSNAIYMRSADDNGNYPSKWERFITYSDMISSFTVENPTGTYSEASLKSQIHQRMITLANEAREQVGYNRSLHIPWSCTWVGYTNISGEVTFFPSDAGNNIYNYMTTLFLYNQAFLCYGLTSNSEMSYFNKLL